MNRSVVSLSLLLFAAMSCPAAVITLTNQGFELGNTSGWTISGSVAATAQTTIGNWTVGPAGTSMAMLTAGSVTVSSLESFFGVTPGLLSGGLPPGTATYGSGIYQDFSGNAGDTVTMYWAYVASDYNPFNDPGFALVTGPGGEQLTVLASIWNGGITVGSYGATGWHAFTYTLPAAGNYRLGFGAVNTADNALPSYLFLDSAPGALTGVGEIPEPGTFALLGAGMLALGLLRRR